MPLLELPPEEPPMPVPVLLLPPVLPLEDEPDAPPADEPDVPPEEPPRDEPLPDVPPLMPLPLAPDVPPVPPTLLPERPDVPPSMDEPPDVLPPVLPDSEPSLLEPLDAPRPACPGGTPVREVALSLLPGVRPSVRDAALPLRPGSLALLEPLLLWLKETLEMPSASAAEVTTNAVFIIDEYSQAVMDGKVQRRQ